MQIETLGDAWTHSVRVWMACGWGPMTQGYQRGRECHYRCDLSMETLVCTRGRDFPMARLRERLRCPRCGSREVRVVWQLPSNVNTQAARAVR